MTPTIISTLEELKNVGKVPITIRLNQGLFPIGSALKAAARHPHELSLHDSGNLTVRPEGHKAWTALRGFTQDVLLDALRRE
jgi:hypothetical protein